MSAPTAPTAGPTTNDGAVQAVTLIPAGAMEWETIQANARDVVKLRRDNALLQIQLRDSTVRVQAVESLLADKVTEIAQLKHEGAANVRLLASYKGLISSLDALARTQAAAS